MVILQVAEANWYAMRRAWRSSVLPAVAQPLVLLVVFAGLLGTHAARVVRDSPGGPALGIVCSSAVVAAASDVANLTFTGFRFGERFRTVVTAPVSPAQLVAGMLVWSFVQGAVLGGVLVLLATPFLGLTVLLELPVLMAIVGLVCAAVAALLGALVARWHRTVQVLNIAGRVLLAPLVLFSATYFPTTSLPHWAALVVQVLPLAHGSVALRLVYAGSPSAALGDVAVVLAWLLAGGALMVRQFHRELTA